MPRMTHFRFRKTAYRLVGVVLLCATHIGVAESSEYRLRYLDERDGLSHNHITRVVQDETGMVWISTWNGLNRYDGSRFVCFTSEPGDGVALPSDRIRNIELREDGNLLCLVEDRLFLFNTQTCRFDRIMGRSFESLCLDISGDYDFLWWHRLYRRLPQD